MSFSRQIGVTSLDAVSKRFCRIIDCEPLSEVQLRQLSLYLIVALWLVAVSLGFGILLRYANTPGMAAVPPTHWPEDSQVTWEEGSPTLLIFVHPHCPCTQATLSELELIMVRCHGQVTAHVLFIQPGGVGIDWLDSDLWVMATRIPGVATFADKDGRESQRFQAMTSGQTLLYNIDGALEFSGGITGARGHAGDNFGRDAIIKFVSTTDESDRQCDSFFVFGCALQSIDTVEGHEATK